MKIKNIQVFGRRWFQRSYGNTYCTASIYINGEHVHTLPKQYGYGDYYLQAAGEWLADNGHIQPIKYDNGGTEHVRQTGEREGWTLEYQAADVSRERDL